jgi:four helix bundle protein
MEPYFDHERLEVYRKARQFNREARLLSESLPRGYSDSKDNLKRAAKSVPRNIAEGAGKWKIPDKVRYYHIARASATECAACLDELIDFGLVDEARLRFAKQILAEIVAMLIAMIRSLESRDRPDMRR